MSDLPPGWTIRKMLPPIPVPDERRRCRARRDGWWGIPVTYEQHAGRSMWLVFVTDGERDRVGWGRRLSTAMRDAARQARMAEGVVVQLPAAGDEYEAAA